MIIFRFSFPSKTDLLENRSIFVKELRWYTQNSWGISISTAIMEYGMGFLKKLKTEVPYDPEILLLSIHPKETKTGSETDTCTPMKTAVLLTMAKIWKQPKCLCTEDVRDIYIMYMCI